MLYISFTNIELKNTTTGEIEKIIKELKSKRSCGYDEITTKILKISSPFIVSPLTYICNRMLYSQFNMPLQNKRRTDN